jgi:hypothetical protein
MKYIAKKEKYIIKNDFEIHLTKDLTYIFKPGAIVDSEGFYINQFNHMEGVMSIIYPYGTNLTINYAVYVPVSCIETLRVYKLRQL